MIRRVTFVVALAVASVVAGGVGSRSWLVSIVPAEANASDGDEQQVDETDYGAESEAEAIADEREDDAKADEADAEAIADEQEDDAKADEADAEAIADEQDDDAEADAADRKMETEEQADDPDAGAAAEPVPTPAPVAAKKPAAAPAVVLESLRLIDQAIELTFSGTPPHPTAKTLQAADGKPERVVLDFPGAKLGKSVVPTAPSGGRLIQVRAGQYQPDVTRVVLELSEPSPTHVRVKKDTVTIQLEDDSQPIGQ